MWRRLDPVWRFVFVGYLGWVVYSILQLTQGHVPYFFVGLGSGLVFFWLSTGLRRRPSDRAEHPSS